MSSASPCVSLFTGDVLPDVHRRSIAVEPMTCPPNAFRTGARSVTLEPGAQVVGALSNPGGRPMMANPDGRASAAPDVAPGDELRPAATPVMTDPVVQLRVRLP
jgi:hypothetical protein